MKFILGVKIGMSQIFDQNGKVVPITLIKAGPCYVTQIKTQDKDSYEAIQIGFEKIKENKTKKSQKGKSFRYLREFQNDISKYKVGQEIDISSFQLGDKVSISGISKGKGFAGAVKRWHFAGSPATHGTKDSIRRIGSIGSRWPQRVRKGKKMPGRMGAERKTIKNLKVVKINPEDNLLALQGAVPGRKGTLLEITIDS
jgi:large subunit ribosomal protein L3